MGDGRGQAGTRGEASAAIGPATGTVAAASAAPPSASDEVTFISGIDSTGKVATTSFWSWDGDNPATYAPPYSQVSKWNAAGASTSTAGTAGGQVKFYFDTASHWTATEKSALEAGLALWSEVANISFVETTSAGAAQVKFVRGSDGGAQTSNHISNVARYGAAGIPEASVSTISIDTSVDGFGPIAGSFTAFGGYTWTTLIHEEGHMLGLGHAGPYDGDVNAQTQQYSAYDTLQWSIMSYIQPSDAALYKSSYPVASNWGISPDRYHNTPTTPMPLDILAVQRLYGLPTNTPLSGGQVFGFHSNITGPTAPFFDFTRNAKPVVTLWDKGTGNTLDLSGFSAASTVNLHPGAFSSVNGLTNDIAIAFGVSIDTAIGGSGNDRIIANDNGDYLVGGGGSDVLIGGAGADTLDGGSGNDSLTGGVGHDVFVAEANGGRQVITDFVAGQDDLDLLGVSGLATASAALAAATQSGSDTVISLGGGASLTLQGVALSSLSAADFIVASGGSGGTGGSSGAGGPTTGGADGDFNGDGKADIIFRGGDGSVLAWASQAAGLTFSPHTLANTAASLQLQLPGHPQDFNGDGVADLLFQRSDGAMQVWNSQPGGGFATAALPKPTGMHLAGAGDMDGDGMSDLLWQRDNGDLVVWKHPGAGTFARQDLGIIAAGQHVEAVADFDGDGKADILFASDANAAQLRLSGSGALTGVGSLGTGWSVSGAADFNGDGKADIMLRSASGADMLWLSAGTAGVFTHKSLASFGAAWTVQEIADFSGDGRPDILWRNANGALLIWVEKPGATSFTPTSIGSTPAGATVQAHVPTPADAQAALAVHLPAAPSTDWHLI